MSHGTDVLEVVAEPEDLQDEHLKQSPVESLYFDVPLDVDQIDEEVEDLLKVLEKDEFRVLVENFNQHLNDGVFDNQRVETNCSKEEHHEGIQVHSRDKLHDLSQDNQFHGHLIIVTALEIAMDVDFEVFPQLGKLIVLIQEVLKNRLHQLESMPALISLQLLESLLFQLLELTQHVFGEEAE